MNCNEPQRIFEEGRSLKVSEKDGGDSPEPKNSFRSVGPEKAAMFWKKVRKGNPEECWEWTAAVMHSGYGVFSINRRAVRAHRVSYVIEFGPIPPDRPCVLHKCDNRKCVNPNHLFAGTKSDNSIDMVAKGRGVGQCHPELMSHGETHHKAKLNREAVLEIRRAHAEDRTGYKKLAIRFGISHTAARDVIQRKNWKHV